MTNPTTIELAPGTYSGPLPTGYLLEIAAAGAARLERPAGPRPLTELATAITTPSTPPARPPGSASRTLGVIALGVFLGLGVTWAHGRIGGASLADPAPAQASRLSPAIEQAAPARAPQEWRPLAWAPGWEGYGREIAGEFFISTWRPIGR